MNAVLIALLVLPLVGAALTLAPVFGADPAAADRRALRLNTVVSGGVLLLCAALAVGFDHDEPGRMQATTDVSWIPAIGVRFHLGVDGVSLPLIVLTALLTFLCALYSEKRLPSGRASPRQGPSPGCSSSSKSACSPPSRCWTSCSSSWPSRSC